MPRIPYHADVDIAGTDLIQSVRQRRGGRLLHIDRMLMHSLPLMRGWGAFLGAVRNELELAPRYRELAILVVSARNQTAYELHHHLKPFISAGGSHAQFEALQNLEQAVINADLFDPIERAVMNLALDMTNKPTATDDCVQAARAALGSDSQAVELVALIAAYNMVSRVVNSLGIGVETQTAEA
ncbi:carboxymuconolactone decarboxylase family protein [Parathalassolituus penaei]|uniref:Carboxymuconolactone decarboxylase family protein n=1 Tax=Parathalassolituus penaei TaxID=2997323 RepID=A0A9X3EIE2_9GAMM|nr:carboxymuconolactone decarboxylase family protein [Parathalassolituus penaei]MCY0967285.1 carboxymuconolactone decarboxylase family protein [Parathalassolituus penaei]